MFFTLSSGRILLFDEFSQDELGKRIDRCEQSTEQLLVAIETMFLGIGVLYLGEDLHFELLRLVCDNWILLKHGLEVLESCGLLLARLLQHGLLQLLPLVHLDISDFVKNPCRNVCLVNSISFNESVDAFFLLNVSL